MVKAQAALEYMAVVSIAMLFLAAIFVSASDYLANLKDTNRILIAREAVDRISEAAKIIYTQAKGSKMSFDVQIPEGVINATVLGNEINIKIEDSGKTTDIFKLLPFNVSGDIPENAGIYRIVVERADSYVNIAYS